jgi:hypothetical protein
MGDEGFRRMGDASLALAYVMGTLEGAERDRVERRLEDDPMFADAVARARREMGDLSRGLARAESRARRAMRWGSTRRTRLIVFISLVLVASLTAGTILLLKSAASQFRAERTLPAQDPARLLADQVDGAEIVAIGSVTDVLHTAIGGRASVVATVLVEEVLKGTAWTFVAAVDDGPVSPGAAWARTGDRFLLFLEPVTAMLPGVGARPMRVRQSAWGRYLIRDGALVDAPFTLASVRARAGADPAASAS